MSVPTARLVEPPPTAGPARQGALVVEIVTAHTAHVRGPGVVPIFDRVGICRQWDPVARCWSMPRRRLQDLAADCQRRGQLLTVQDVSR